MTKIIDVTIREKIAANLNGDGYVCGNSDYAIKFDFDEEWDEFEYKTARFVYNGKFTDVIFSGNQCAVPVIADTRVISVGVYAGDLETSTPALIGAKKSILCDSGSPAAPSDNVYHQLMALLENLVDRVEALEGGGVVDTATAELGAAILGKLKLR